MAQGTAGQGHCKVEGRIWILHREREQTEMETVLGSRSQCWPWEVSVCDLHCLWDGS